MTDPERLLSGGTPFERTLLAAGVADEPNAALVARMEQGLGLGSTAAASSAVTLKLVAVLGTTVAGGLMAWGLLSSDGRSPEGDGLEARERVEAPAGFRAEAERADSPERGGVLPEPGNEASGGAAEPQAAQAPRETSNPAPRRASLPREASKAAAAPLRDDLSREVRELDRVRAALEAGKKRRALALLDAYDRRFPKGALTPEARKLRHRAREVD